MEQDMKRIVKQNRIIKVRLMARVRTPNSRP